jgi:RNA 2',3'-cyclic 3'-phosphodiesterase
VRLFVGCEIGAAVADAATALIGDLQARVARQAPHARLTWVPRERLHVTVRFIGAVDAARVPALAEALATPLRHPVFEALVEGVGVFPDRRPPRVIWAGFRSGGRELAAVAREVNARLAPLVGDDPEELRPHLTLARVKEAHGLRAQPLLAGLETLSLGATRIDAVTLFESRQGTGGLRYVPLLKTALET